MIYELRDFLGEVADNYGMEGMNQSLHSNLKDFELVSRGSSVEGDQEVDQRYVAFLELNDYVRLENNTAYKVHKGYPSPRSLYPIKLFLALGDRYFLNKNDLDESISCYKYEGIELKKGDLLLEFDDKYPDHYLHIKKTLLLLEMGHFLYNIFFLAKRMGIEYKLNCMEQHIYLELIADKGRDIEESELARFRSAYTKRNSGAYLHPLTKPHNDLVVDLDQLNSLIQHVSEDSSSDLNLNSTEGIQVFTYYNAGEGNFVSTNPQLPHISYRVMNKIHPYINFYGVSFFTFFSLNHNLLKNRQGTESLLACGYVAQAICLEYADEHCYVRPIKSLVMDQIETLFARDSTHYTPFYFLIGGSK